MTGSTDLRNPVVLWAQRRDCVYLTIAVEDCKNADLKIEVDKILFKGDGGDKHRYASTLNLYGKVKSDESKYVVRDRNIEILLKKDAEQYWPRLLNETTKMHWLKVDFNKWKDEDDSDEEVGGGGNFEDMMRQMGGFGGMGGMGDFDGPEEEDSDDEELPDLEAAKEKNEEEKKE